MVINTETRQSNFNVNIHHLCVHILVHNKYLLFNVHGMNIKIALLFSCTVFHDIFNADTSVFCESCYQF